MQFFRKQFVPINAVALKQLTPAKMCQRFLLPTLLLSSLAFATPRFEALENAMTTEERAQAGLNKLTRKELDFLNRWLSQRAIPPQANSELSYMEENESQEAIEFEVQRRVADRLATAAELADSAARTRTYSASVMGDFSGWQGKTIFRLDNGEIWRQKGTSKYRYRGSSQAVRLTQNWAGGWEMEVVSTGKRVLVKKIR